MAAGSIGVVGAGTMGTGIAQVAAMGGHEVLLYDTRPDALIAAREQLNATFNRLVEKGKLTDREAKAIFGRIYLLESLTGMHDAILIIEAIVEDIHVKRNLFRTLEDISRPDTILATNTSSLSISSIAGFCKYPGRVIGMHFFNPAPLMQLVEIIPALQTSHDVYQRVYALLNAWDKITVRAGDTPGFIVNRIARPYYSEALKIYEERILHDIPDGPQGFKVIDDAMTELGFRMGPFALMDFIGNDVNYAVTRSVWEACFFEPRYMPSQLQRQLVEAGWFGKKSGRGYYQYDTSEISAASLKHELKQHIQDRISVMLMHEAADAVLRGIASPADIDLAMTKGANYPFELLKELDDRGAGYIVETIDRLFEEYHDPRYRCSPLLRKYAREKRSFYS